ncbi:MAG: 4Fe-4S dicluster domain-containing protein [Candidatus Lernaella stagnicola]|nr:4Fe-4S dicluster domain-containing protein [Candidatus Lernaella stagnicola]
MSISRRNFLKLAVGTGAAGAAAAAGVPGKADAAHDFEGYPDRFGVLFDSSLCIGCRSCEAACNEVNDLPEQEKPFDDQSVFDARRRNDYSRYTVVNRYGKEETGGAVTFVKTQCMHCDEPACFAACLAKAFTKTPEGAVVYDAGHCIGCRYCIQACPFYIPTYEYHDAFTPRVSKCTMCYSRLTEGQVPGCVDACPSGALIFGRRDYLIKVARERIGRKDSGYVDHIYGEKEVGGTCWMYISKVPFEKIGFNTHVGTTAMPKLTYGYLKTIPVMHMGLPVLLAGFWVMTRGIAKAAKAKQEGGQ